MHLTLVTEWKRSNIPSILNWWSDISSDNFLSSVLLGVSVMVIVTVGVTVVVVAAAVVVVVVVVVVMVVVVCLPIIKLPFVIIVPLSRVTLNLPV